VLLPSPKLQLYDSYIGKVAALEVLIKVNKLPDCDVVNDALHCAFDVKMLINIKHSVVIKFFILIDFFLIINIVSVLVFFKIIILITIDDTTFNNVTTTFKIFFKRQLKLFYMPYNKKKPTL
jgi:competence protein ComGC